MKTGVIISIILLTASLIARAAGSLLPFWSLEIAQAVNISIFVLVAILLAHVVNTFVKSRSLRRTVHYFLFLLVVIAVFLSYQDKLITLGISLGILAVAVTYIFQVPLLSLVAWLYLHVGGIYDEGDRIKISEIKGDVISINPFVTTILEVGGEHLSSDVLSGRIVNFPNSLLLSQPVLNYTKHGRVIWVEVAFQLTYETDFKFVKKESEKILKKHLEKLLKKTGRKLRFFSEYLSVKSNPIKYILTPNMSWIDYKVLFPVDPESQAVVKSEITEKLISVFKKNPGKVRFPKGRSR